MTADGRTVGARPSSPAGSRPARTVHLFGMGFRQTLGGNSGQIALWKEARRFSGPRHFILTPITWCEDADAIAALLYQLAPARIFGYFYSWGAGQLFRELAEEMQQIGLEFEAVVLCDPVGRSTLFPAWLPLNPLSLTRLHRVVVPANVRQVHRFYQRQDRPGGHPLKIVDPVRTTYLTDVELGVPHARMEDHPAYHDLVLSLIEQAVAA